MTLTRDLMVVDFPAPLCPISPMIFPLSIVKLSPSKATVCPYTFETFLNSIMQIPPYAPVYPYYITRVRIKKDIFLP